VRAEACGVDYHDEQEDQDNTFVFLVQRPSLRDKSKGAMVQMTLYNEIVDAPHTTISQIQACDGVIGDAKKVVLKNLTIHERILLQQAITKEVGSFVTNKVLQPVTKREYLEAEKLEGTRPIKMKFVYEWKSQDGVKILKARLVAEGTLRGDTRRDLKTSVSIPTLRALRVLQLITLQRPNYKPEDIKMADMKTSFLQAPELTPTWYTKPKLPEGYTCPELDDMFGPTGLAKGLKTVYGQRNASYGLDVFVRDKITSEGFIELRSVRQVYIRFTLKGKTYEETMAIAAEDRAKFTIDDWCIDSWLYAYVDDFQAGPGSDNGTLGGDVIKSLSAKINFKGEPEVLSKFQGIHMHATEAGIWWDQHAQAKGAYPRAKLVKAAQPLMTSVDLHERFQKSPVLDEKEHTRYRKILGSLGYLAHTRLDLLYAITLMSQYAHAPTKDALDTLKRIGCFAYSTASRGLFTPAANAIDKIELANDRSWATTKTQAPVSSPLSENSKLTRAKYHLDLVTDASHGDRSVSGFIIMLNGSPICYRSYIQRRVCNSSTAAEVQALYDGMDTLAATAFLLKELGIQDLSTAVWVDSNNLVAAVHKVNPNVTEPSTLLQLRQIQDMCSNSMYPATQPDLDGNCAPLDPTVIHSSDRGPVASRWVTLNHPSNIVRAVNGINSTIIALKAQVYHLAGKTNPADPLTKAMKIDNLLNTCLHDYEDFLKASRKINPEVKSMLLEEEEGKAVETKAKARKEKVAKSGEDKDSDDDEEDSEEEDDRLDIDDDLLEEVYSIYRVEEMHYFDPVLPETEHAKNLTPLPFNIDNPGSPRVRELPMYTTFFTDRDRVGAIMNSRHNEDYRCLVTNYDGEWELYDHNERNRNLIDNYIPPLDDKLARSIMVVEARESFKTSHWAFESQMIHWIRHAPRRAVDLPLARRFAELKRICEKGCQYECPCNKKWVLTREQEESNRTLHDMTRFPTTPPVEFEGNIISGGKAHGEVREKHPHSSPGHNGYVLNLPRDHPAVVGCMVNTLVEEEEWDVVQQEWENEDNVDQHGEEPGMSVSREMEKNEEEVLVVIPKIRSHKRSDTVIYKGKETNHDE